LSYSSGKPGHPAASKPIPKREWLERLDDGADLEGSDKKYAKLRKIVGPDPLPYGLEANRKTIG